MEAYGGQTSRSDVAVMVRIGLLETHAGLLGAT
jgi:hypothetical protein